MACRGNIFLSCWRDFMLFRVFSEATWKSGQLRIEWVRTICWSSSDKSVPISRDHFIIFGPYLFSILPNWSLLNFGNWILSKHLCKYFLKISRWSLFVSLMVPKRSLFGNFGINLVPIGTISLWGLELSALLILGKHHSAHFWLLELEDLSSGFWRTRQNAL